MKTFLIIKRKSQAESIADERKPYARPQRPHGKKGEYKRREKYPKDFID